MDSNCNSCLKKQSRWKAFFAICRFTRDVLIITLLLLIAAHLVKMETTTEEYLDYLVRLLQKMT